MESNQKDFPRFNTDFKWPLQSKNVIGAGVLTQGLSNAYYCPQTSTATGAVVQPAWITTSLNFQQGLFMDLTEFVGGKKSIL